MSTTPASSAETVKYELEIDAQVGSLKEIMAFLEEIMERHEVPMKVSFQINVAVEEIFVNIAHYGYPSGTGRAKIEAEVDPENSRMAIRFVDQGQPYNPLEKKDPDITLPPEEREVGGLGIFMVKQSMDSMDYEYRDGSNVLTIVKSY